MKYFVQILKYITILVCVGIFTYIFLLRQSESPKIATQEIEASLEDIGELATSEYRYKISQVSEKPNKKVLGFNLPFTDSKVLYSYEGVIKAGLQFESIKFTVNEAKKTIYVELPDTQILSQEVFPDSLLVYDASYSPFNNFTFEDMNLSLKDLKERAQEDAIKNGLLEAAHDNAINILNSTLSRFYDQKEYQIEYY